MKLFGTEYKSRAMLGRNGSQKKRCKKDFENDMTAPDFFLGGGGGTKYPPSQENLINKGKSETGHQADAFSSVLVEWNDQPQFCLPLDGMLVYYRVISPPSPS